MTIHNIQILVRRALLRTFSGCDSRPATVVPAGSNPSGVYALFIPMRRTSNDSIRLLNFFECEDRLWGRRN